MIYTHLLHQLQHQNIYCRIICLTENTLTSKHEHDRKVKHLVVLASLIPDVMKLAHSSPHAVRFGKGIYWWQTHLNHLWFTMRNSTRNAYALGTLACFTEEDRKQFLFLVTLHLHNCVTDILDLLILPLTEQTSQHSCCHWSLFQHYGPPEGQTNQLKLWHVLWV